MLEYVHAAIWTRVRNTQFYATTSWFTVGNLRENFVHFNKSVLTWSITTANRTSRDVASLASPLALVGAEGFENLMVLDFS